MLKNILNLKGAQQLSKNEQQAISGGFSSSQCQSTCNNCAGFCFPFNCSPSTVTPVPGYVCITVNT